MLRSFEYEIVEHMPVSACMIDVINVPSQNPAVYLSRHDSRRTKIWVGPLQRTSDTFRRRISPVQPTSIISRQLGSGNGCLEIVIDTLALSQPYKEKDSRMQNICSKASIKQ
jgi:hypothetical protein